MQCKSNWVVTRPTHVSKSQGAAEEHKKLYVGIQRVSTTRCNAVICHKLTAVLLALPEARPTSDAWVWLLDADGLENKLAQLIYNRLGLFHFKQGRNTNVHYKGWHDYKE